MSDYSFIANNPQGNPINNLNGMMTLANGMQNYKRGNIELQKSQQTMESDIAQSKATSQTEQEQAQQQHLATIQQQGLNGAQEALSLYGQGKTPDAVRQHITDYMNNAGAKPDAIQQAVSNVPNDPAQINQYLVDSVRKTVGALAQLNSKFPAPAMQDNGGTIQPIAQGNKALTGVAPGTPQGPAIDKELPPTTQVATPEGGTNYLGSRKGRGAVPASLPPQEVSKNVNRQAVINEDWKTTTADAQDAPMKIGVLQNIKAHIPNAVMGQSADQRQVIAGYAQLLGMQSGEIEKTNTDLLAKNASMLAAQGGNTDASRAIAAVMNPNAHMTPEAAMRAADQIGAQIQIKVLKQQYLQPFMTESGHHPEGYEKALSSWNKNSDPRVLQWSSLSPQEKTEMKAGMNAAQQKEFKDKLQWMEDRGLAK